ncbi:MAG: MptD family putative ECF transporter S component [Succinivibrio sp.]|nr:MptD family putative ECF transporter S component [Succinivibrio sp.]
MKKRYFNCRELVVIGVFAASVKVVTMLIALAGGGLNPVSLILKNLVFTTLMVVLLYKVRKTGALTLFSLVSALISFVLLGGGITSIPSSLCSAMLTELCVILTGGCKRSYAPVVGAFFYDLISKTSSLCVSYIMVRETPGVIFMVVGIVAIGYIGSFLGLGTGVYCARELKHAGIINR